jgi:hypothetical protein
MADRPRFARVLVFLMLAAVGFIGANVTPDNQAGSIICGIIGRALAWPLAGIPIHYWRRQIMLKEQRITGGHTVTSRKHWGLAHPTSSSRGVGLALYTSVQHAPKLDHSSD